MIKRENGYRLLRYKDKENMFDVQSMDFVTIEL